MIVGFTEIFIDAPAYSYFTFINICYEHIFSKTFVILLYHSSLKLSLLVFHEVSVVFIAFFMSSFIVILNAMWIKNGRVVIEKCNTGCQSHFFEKWFPIIFQWVLVKI